MPQNVFQRVGSNGANMMLFGADEAEIQIQMGCQRSCFFAQVSGQRDKIPILQGKGMLLRQMCGQREVVDQSQKAVVVLVHQCRPGIQSGILFTGRGGNQLRSGQMKRGQRVADLGRNIGEQGYQIVPFRIHGSLLSGAEALRIAFTAERKTPEENTAFHTSSIPDCGDKDKKFVESCRMMALDSGTYGK